ncbi:MAG: glycoside hydrolase family 92 protein [Bacteroidia bacterium]|nr:MAG: glycoside hydrolase family 92 protein [Bacteroidia bacterium]
MNWDNPVECNISFDDGKLSGLRRSSGWAKNQYQYFVSMLSIEPSAVFVPGDSGFVKGKEVSGRESAMMLTFDMKSGEELLVKTGLSAVDTRGAEMNLQAEIPGWDFEKIRNEAWDRWNTELGRISAESSDTDVLKVFYTSLYHSFMAPVLYSDVDSRYRGADGEIHTAEGFINYTLFSLWDTFRAAHPLYTIVQPNRVPDMINSMLNIYKEQGKLPVWSLMANETNTMIGYHAVPVIADAMSKGISGFDYDLAYEAAKHSSELDFRGLNYYRQYGYVPADLENESVSKTLEYAYDDWCIASIAKINGDVVGFQKYSQRADYYKNLFDTSTGFMRGRLADGSWKEPFDPLYSSHRQDEYTEGNAWQYTWFVPHDIFGLVELMGGKERFIERLDSLFILDEGVRGENASSDISGLIGAYAHGNEPGHHTTYIYSVLGESAKTETLVRKIMSEMYHTGIDGLCGNEDCGQMSAWYVFSALGFYPFNPADGRYYFGSPVIDRASISLPGNLLFTVEAKNNSPENIHISGAELNGIRLDRNWITHEELMTGGTLVFNMTSDTR